ncbi:OLC1v1020572C1 [Oldenlandia corymbosa var. corymbosa]|uniref:OLC1v1020572C1 n=1 Tax=Oldenlandia corymbosa var. corymbosa TaxID=529605 RepID=A0AAV1EGX1_OLDCO|nr:OLC1v1020572C1 [Oldenlandia corymbosa var. corymbosa]
MALFTTLFRLLFLLLLPLFFLVTHSHGLELNSTNQKPKAVYFTITKKGPFPHHYYMTYLRLGTPSLQSVNLAVDLGGDSVWVDCDNSNYKNSSSFKAVNCRAAQCDLLRSTACGNSCNITTTNRTSPPWYCSTRACYTKPVNPFSSSAAAGSGVTGVAVRDVISIRNTADEDLSPPWQFVFTCAPSSFSAGSLPGDIKGVVGLGDSLASLPTQFTHTFFTRRRKFFVCLPERSRGVVIVGDHDLNPEFYRTFIHTPLLRRNTAFPYKGNESMEYYVCLVAIKVNGRDVPVNRTLTCTFDDKGNGGTKISTVDPYSVLESSMYQPFLKAFLKELPSFSKGAKLMKNPVKPFGACFTGMGINRTGLPRVPPIDLVFMRTEYSNDVTWRIHGGNSMVRVSGDVMCFGFVEQSRVIKKDMKQPAMVIGGYQIEESVLEFDPSRSKVGFSPRLEKAKCDDFKPNHM